MISAGVARERCLLRARRGTDDGRAAQLRDLAEQEADAARRGVDEAGVAGAQRVGRGREVVRRHALQHRRGAVAERHRIGQLHEAVGGDDAHLRVRAGDAAVRDAIARSHVAHVVADRRDRARRLEPERPRNGVRVEAGAEVDVDEVHAGGRDLHQRLAACQCRVGDVLVPQHFGAARLMNADRLHALSPFDVPTPRLPTRCAARALRRVPRLSVRRQLGVA